MAEMEGKKTPRERKFVPVSNTAAETSANANAATENAVSNAPEKTPKARANSMRVIAVILWLAAVVFEILTILLLNKTLIFSKSGDNTVWLIGGIVLDLICVIIGSLLWKKANHIDPASEKNKTKFFLWNNMGVIAAIIAFLPLVIILLTNKNLNAKTKKIVTIVAAVALIFAVVFSIDYHPASAEDLTQAKQESTVLGNGTAYWTVWGHSYHFDPNCRTLLNSATVYSGTVEQAFEAGRTDPCDFCAGGADAKETTSEVESTP
jgi:hypothetical protein